MGEGNPAGGSIIRTAATNGGTITIYRDTTWKQLVDLEDKQRNPAQAVEDQLDRLTMAGQDTRNRVGVIEGKTGDLDDAVARAESAQLAAEAAKASAEDSAAAALVSKQNANDDAIAAAADRVQTGLDAAATGADRTQTGLDAIAAAADRVQTGLDRAATDADRAQTGLDAIATAADRVQTGLDATASGSAASVATTAKDDAVVAKNAAEAAAAGLNLPAIGSGDAGKSLVVKQDETGFEFGDGGDVAGSIHEAGSKTPPVDDDELGLADSEGGWSLKKLTWANLKAALASVFLPLSGGTVAGNVRVNGSLGLNRAGVAGGAAFHRDNGTPFIVFSGGDPEAPTNIAQVRTDQAGNRIGFTNSAGSAWGLFVSTADNLPYARANPTEALGVATKQYVDDLMWTELAPVNISGTAIDWTSIPAGVSDVEMWWDRVSGNSTDHFIVQVGTGGSPTTTGYEGGSGVAGAASARVIGTAGFIVFYNNAAYELSGVVRLHRTTGNTWVAEHVMASSVADGLGFAGGGRVTLSGALNNMRLRSLGGTQAFDKGAVRVRYR